jgi:hypothetical protein
MKKPGENLDLDISDALINDGPDSGDTVIITLPAIQEGRDSLQPTFRGLGPFNILLGVGPSDLDRATEGLKQFAVDQVPPIDQ